MKIKICNVAHIRAQRIQGGHMIIDFHTHTFPDKIAERTMKVLAERCGLTPRRSGTVGSLKESMKRGGVDLSVVLPVATSPRQEPSINAESARLNGRDGLYFAGAIHPDCPDVDSALDAIKAYGFFGIKLHPDYQRVFFDDERYINIIAKAAERDLMIVTHAGLDVGYRDCIHCTPDMILRVLDRLGDSIADKLVLAHLGSYDNPDEVLEKLVGKPVYMDTAAVLGLQTEKRERIIKAHGADKILFASDSPWADQLEYINILNSFDLSERDKRKIFCENALRLLGIGGSEN